MKTHAFAPPTLHRPAPLLVLMLVTSCLPGVLWAQCDCPPLPPPGPEEEVVFVSTTSALLAALDATDGGSTIYLERGTYSVTSSQFVTVRKPHVTLRSVSGARDDVVIEGEGMAAGGLGMGIYIDADNVTIADLTVRDVQNHGFFINPGADSVLLHNVRGVDCGEQIVKASGYATLPPKHGGVIECSLFEYTTVLDDGDDGWYTNGIDLLNCHNWVIRDNVIRNIRHNPALTSTLAGPAILAWHGCSGTIVERNRIIDCDFGISFGNAGQGGESHRGGLIRDNFVRGHGESDFGIGLIYAPEAHVVNNTVYSPGGWAWSIEARFPETRDCLIMNNFTDEPLLPDRDGASVRLISNVAGATPADFVDAANGDLHLRSQHSAAVDAATPASGRWMDIDCELLAEFPDAGADEFMPATAITGPGHPVEDVQIFPQPATGAVTVSGRDIRDVRVWSIDGRLLRRYQQPEVPLRIDLCDRAEGVYLLTIVRGTDVLHRTMFLR